jgi:cytochrome c oxidase subunit IV
MAAHPSHAAHHDDGAVHVHIAPTRFYWAIFAALVVLTVATVKVSYYDFGSANIIIALVIASTKASLVAAFFMHLRHDKLFNTLILLAAFLFLSLFILLTWDDLGIRAHDHGYAQKISPETGLGAPGGEPATSATANDVAGEAEGPPKGSGDKKE